MPTQQVICHSCGAALTYEPPLSRSATCESCGAYLHCCRNCRFYDPQAPNHCREPQAELVRDEEAANFCGYFEPRTSGGTATTDRAAEARRRLEELFRKKPSG